MEKESKDSFAQIKDGSIDAGLFVLSVLFPEGCPYTLEEIAYVCGCHKSNIWYYEKNGLKKLKEAFKSRGFDKENLPF
jgi:DNA-directed RNA polymerase sigma subunit (sigma70/sigma32)